MTSEDQILEELILRIKYLEPFEAEVIALKAKILAHEHQVSKVMVSAIRDLARTECPVSGYIITSKESRKQMLDWADFSERCDNDG